VKDGERFTPALQGDEKQPVLVEAVSPLVPARDFALLLLMLLVCRAQTARLQELVEHAGVFIGHDVGFDHTRPVSFPELVFDVALYGNKSVDDERISRLTSIEVAHLTPIKEEHFNNLLDEPGGFPRVVCDDEVRDQRARLDTHEGGRVDNRETDIVGEIGPTDVVVVVFHVAHYITRKGRVQELSCVYSGSVTPNTLSWHSWHMPESWYSLKESGSRKALCCASLPQVAQVRVATHSTRSRPVRAVRRASIAGSLRVALGLFMCVVYHSPMRISRTFLGLFGICGAPKYCATIHLGSRGARPNRGIEPELRGYSMI